jgi:hypothetical protein
MPGHQPTAADPIRQDPFRWPHADILTALDDFADPDPPSQRQFAQQAGIPHATFNYWLRHYSPAEADPIDAFFRSGCGELVLGRILAAVLLVFGQRGACGIRLVSEFLQLAQLDRFLACSRGALHPLAVHLESDLAAFRDEQQPLLAQQMQPRSITLVPDEHFHGSKPCLVAVEPLSGFIPVECYRDRRDADTWTEAIQEGTRGMPVEVVQLTSDLARGLLRCAEKGLHAAHSPDLFHGQRDLLGPLLLPLNRPVQQAQKDLEKAKQLSSQLDGPLDEPRSWQQFVGLVEAVKTEQAISKQLEEARGLKEEAVKQVRGVADDYHPFDRETGQPLTAEEVGKRLNGHLDELQEVAREAGLGEKAKEALNKSRTWVGTLMGCVAWFWGLANGRVEQLQLSEEQEQVVKEKLLAGHYWGMAAGRARTAEERKRLLEMAEGLKKEAWQQGGALSRLPQEERLQVEEVARESAGLFQRSSSCVEGRNGRLSLQQHGHSRVSERRLKALTVIHNYMVKRSDGTTAAQRFFGQEHKDVFSWLLQRLPDLPRPAAKRPQSAAQSLPVAG